MSIITLTTDIGWFYASQMKARILSINPDAKIVDITHDVSPQNVTEGAYILYSSVVHFPEAIHIAVIDPGVGTARKPLIVKCGETHLVGPDNGVLIPAALRLGIEGVYEITKKADSISDTFHGRDIFAPVASYLSLGVKAEEMGREFGNYEELDFGNVDIGETITGKIIFVDKFGNIITNIPGDLSGLDYGDKVKIKISGKEMEVKLLKSYGYAEKGEMLLTVSSSDFLEVSCRDGDACRMLGAEVGGKVEISMIS